MRTANQTSSVQDGIRRITDRLNTDSLASSMRILAHEIRSQYYHSEDAISLRPLIERLGIDYKTSKYDAVDLDAAACLRVKNGKFQILVNSAASSNWRRARFSIAHEIGHFMLIMYGGIQLTYEMQGDPQLNQELEDACDIFAQELLIPSRKLADDLMHIRAKGFKHIYRKYAVSEHVALRAIVDLTPATSWVILQSRPDEAREDIKSRVAFCYPHYKSGDTNRIWLPKNFGSNRISKTSKMHNMPGYDYMAGQLRLGKDNKEIYITRIKKNRTLGIADIPRHSILLTDINQRPLWINEN